MARKKNRKINLFFSRHSPCHLSECSPVSYKTNPNQMKIKSFKIKVKKPKARGFAIPPNRVIKDKTQYSRKQKYKGGYEL